MDLKKNLKSRSFFTNKEPIENIIESIKEQVVRHGCDTCWKINLVPITTGIQPINPQGYNYTSNTTQSDPCKSTLITSTVQYPTSPETDPRAYIVNLEERLRRSHEAERQYEKISRLQSIQIKKMKEQSMLAQDTIQSVYEMKSEEDKIRFINEISYQRIEIKSLKKKLEQMEFTIKRIDKVKIPTKDFLMNRDELIVDRFNLLRKLKVTELRLEIRELELRALYEHKLKNKKREIMIKSNDTYEEQQEKENIQSVQNPINIKKVPSLASLSILADRLLKSSQISVVNKSLSLPSSPMTPVPIQSTIPRPASITATINNKRPMTIVDIKDIQNNNKKPKTSIPSIKLTYKNHWTSDEDNLLFKQVEIHGSNNWDRVSKSMPHRSGSECYRRYQEMPTTANNSKRSSIPISSLIEN